MHVARSKTQKSLSRALSFFWSSCSLLFFSPLSLLFSHVSLSLTFYFLLCLLLFSLFLSVSLSLSRSGLSFLLFPAILNASSVREVFRERHFAVLRNARACTREKREREKETTHTERERETRRERVNQYSLPTEVSLSLRSFSPA